MFTVWRDKLARYLLTILGEKEALYLREQNDRLVYALNRMREENNALELYNVEYRNTLTNLETMMNKKRDAWRSQQEAMAKSIADKKLERDFYRDMIKVLHPVHDEPTCRICKAVETNHPFGPRKVGV